MDTTPMAQANPAAGYPPAVRGRLLTGAAGFTNLLSVVVPYGSGERHYGPFPWPAIHGATLPAAGAECVVLFDDQHQGTIVWWDGEHS